MNWRWLIFDYADPDLRMTIRQRFRCSFRMIPLWKLPPGARSRRMIFALLICVPTLAWIAFSQFFIKRIIDVGAYWMFIPIILGLGFGAYAWGCIVFGLICRREIYYRIRLEGYDVCTKCGYWLRELPDDITVCPECGAEREAMPGGSS